MADTVFISFSETDLDAANRLKERVVEAGLNVWLASSNMAAADGLTSVFSHIQNADWFVVVLSAAAVKSSWVQKELAVAITRQLSGGALRVLPVYLDAVERPPAVADLVSVDLREPHWDEGIQEILAVLLGERRERVSLVTAFEQFVQRAVPLDEEKCRRIQGIASATRKSAPTGVEAVDQYQEEVRQRAWRFIHSLLDETGIPEVARQRILRAVEHGGALPALDPDRRDDVRRWLRQADEELIELAAALWRTRGRNGVTLGWIEDTLERRAGRRRAEDRRRDEELVCWRAERLSQRALNVGLLARSTEAPMNDAIDPSFDTGPWAEVIGRLASAFEEERTSVTAANGERHPVS